MDTLQIPGLQIPGFQNIQIIYESNLHLICQGEETKTGRFVVLKLLKSAYPLSDEISKLKRAYDAVHALSIPGIVKIDQIETYQNSPLLIMEDFGGQSLKTFIDHKPLTIATFLNIAMQLVETLGLLQQAHIIHNNLKTNHIIIHPETTEVKITDFSLSSTQPNDDCSTAALEQLGSSLSYVSPEQTGRINLSIDYRTDYYSLGVIFYEMLTGTLPFPSQDPLELIHCHIAHKPQPPYLIKSTIPKAISDIVMKCMAKTKEERYQGAYGIYVDLQKCWDLRGHPEGIPAFTIGEEDRHETLQISQKLYGRTNELRQLQNLFEQRDPGKLELALISGYPGTGKTALVHEARKMIALEHGYFISGHFDPYKHDLPYYCFIVAFRDLIRQLLSENVAHIDGWKHKLMQAFGFNGKLLTDLIPELKLIVGDQPEVPKLPAIEAQNRLCHLFRQFIQVFLQGNRPFCIFLDNLQWSDPASLDLFRSLLDELNDKRLFLIGAFRDNEITDEHPLKVMLAKMRTNNMSLHEIKLNALKLEHVAALISDTLSCDRINALPLAEAIYNKTAGNPFFIHQFIKSLYDEHLLVYCLDNGKWVWELAKIERLNMTDNVVELLLQNLLKLPIDTQHVLRIAACIGNTFDLNLLAAATNQTLQKTNLMLWEALNNGVVTPMPNQEKSYQFSHDRVQQAVYALIPHQEKELIHLTIGRLLLANDEINADNRLLFAIVNQFNHSLSLLTDSNEKLQVIHLNIRAGTRAMELCAYDSAADFLSNGKQLLGEHSWQEEYELVYTLHLMLAEAKYLCGYFEEAETLILDGYNHAKSRIDKAKLYHLNIILHTNRANYTKAVRIGMEGLKLFGLILPSQPRKGSIMREYALTRWHLINRNVRELYNLPEMTNKDKQMMLQLIITMSAPCFVVNPQLYHLSMLKAFNLCLKFGLTEYSSPAFMAYGYILGAMFHKFKLGSDFGYLSLRISDKYENQIIQSKNHFVFAKFINHWKNPIKSSIPLFEKAYQHGIQSGNLMYSGYAITSIVYTKLFHGEPLEEIKTDIAKWTPFQQKSPEFNPNQSMQIAQQFISTLKSETEQPFFPNPLHADNKLQALNYTMAKLQYDFLFGKFNEALQTANAIEGRLDVLLGTQTIPLYTFYAALTLAALYKPQYRKKLFVHHKQLKIWAYHCPENYAPFELLVSAEINRLTHRETANTSLYDQAISAAASNGSLLFEAIGNELAANYYIERGMHKIAKTYLLEAYFRYQQWGGIAKANQLQKKYPQILFNPHADPTSILADSTSHRGSALKKLDLITIIKASQAISGEINRDALLTKLLAIVIENAGAEKGFLILEKDGRLFVEAECDLRLEHSVVLHSEAIEDCGHLSAAIVQFTARTKEDVILGNAALENRFSQDPYIAARKPKSILCIPILHQGNLIGVLYLENNLSNNVFTDSHLEVLKLLSSQFAISIQNAALYASLGTRPTV